MDNVERASELMRKLRGQGRSFVILSKVAFAEEIFHGSSPEQAFKTVVQALQDAFMFPPAKAVEILESSI